MEMVIQMKEKTRPMEGQLTLNNKRFLRNFLIENALW